MYFDIEDAFQPDFMLWFLLRYTHQTVHVVIQ